MILALRYYQLKLSEPFVAGSELDSAGAGWLNRIRGLQIRETWLKRTEASRLLDPEELRRLRAEISEYDLGYHLPTLVPLKVPYTLDEELESLRAAGGYRESDLEALARRRFAARTGLAEVSSLEDLI